MKEKLSRSSFFRGLPPEHLDLFVSKAEQVTVPIGDTLIRVNQPVDSLYLILSGEMTVISDGQGSSDELAESRGPGRVLGTRIFRKSAHVYGYQCTRDAEVLKWSKDTFDELFKTYPKMQEQLETRASVDDRKQEIIGTLKKSYLFKDISASIIMNLLSSATLALFYKDHYVCEQGEMGDTFYLILDGEVSILKDNNLIGTIETGSFFGEMALLEASPRSASVVCARDSKLLILDRTDFENLYREAPSFQKSITEIFLERSVRVFERKITTEIIGVVNSTSLRLPGFLLLLRDSMEKQTGHKVLVAFCSKDKTPDSEEILVIEPAKLADFLEETRKSDAYRQLLLFFDKDIEEELLTENRYLVNNVIYLATKAKSEFPYPDLSNIRVRYVYYRQKETALPARMVRPHATLCFPESVNFSGKNPKVSAANQQVIDRVARYVLNRRVGLALGGGAAWGLSHIALLRALEKEGVPIDMISGSSIGALIGSFYCDNGLDGLNTLLDVTKIMSPIAMMSMVTSQASERMTEHYLNTRKIEDLPIPFFPVAVNLNNAEEKVFRQGSLAVAVTASNAMPGIFSPVMIDGERYVDGGVLNNVPTSVLSNEGADFIISAAVVQKPRQQKAFMADNPLFDLFERAAPHKRLLDSVNSMFIMFLSNSAAGESLADVRFAPDLHGFKPGDYHHSNKIIERTDEQLGDFIPKLREVYDRRFPSDDE